MLPRSLQVFWSGVSGFWGTGRVASRGPRFARASSSPWVTILQGPGPGEDEDSWAPYAEELQEGLFGRSGLPLVSLEDLLGVEEAEAKWRV